MNKKIIVLILFAFVISCSLFDTPQDILWWNQSFHSGRRKDSVQPREFLNREVSRLNNSFDIRIGISGMR